MAEMPMVHFMAYYFGKPRTLVFIDGNQEYWSRRNLDRLPLKVSFSVEGKTFCKISESVIKQIGA